MNTYNPDHERISDAQKLRFADFEYQDQINRRRYADTREYRQGLAEAEHRIERLETALTATIRALAFGKTNLSDGYVNRHDLCSAETAEHLARAAQALGLDLADLGLTYAVEEQKQP